MSNDLITWHNWSEETFKKAVDEDRAIFLSIGYVGCYWCEQMERESFVDEEIATLLKESFIAIRVDSNQRPDIGLYFHKVFKQMTGRVGNYPVSIFMTPQRIPFYAATYMPARRRDGMMGFDETLELVKKKYAQERATLVAKGTEILRVMSDEESSIEATRLDSSLIAVATQQIKELADSEHGGFGQAPKFLRHSVLNLLMDIYEQSRDEELLDILHTTLISMLDAKIRDLDGGFHRYATDRAWQSPQKGKTLYDNALMVETLARAYSITKEQRYRDAAVDTVLFVQRYLSDDGLYMAMYNTQSTIDSRVIVAWNAMMISSLCRVSSIDSSYMALAEESISKLLSLMSDGTHLPHLVATDGEPVVSAMLEDYAYLGEALMLAHEMTGKEQYLIKTSELLNEAIGQFFAGGRWRFANGQMSTLADIADREYPSAISKIASLLQKASKLISPEYQKFLTRTLEVHSYELMRQPIATPELCRVAIRELG